MSVFGLMPGEHIAKFHPACGEDNNNLSCEAVLHHFRIQQAPTTPLTRRSMGELEARAAAKSKQHEDQDLIEKRRIVNRAGSSGWIMVVLIYGNVLCIFR